VRDEKVSRVRIDKEIMDGVMRNIKDNDMSKKDFVTQAVEEKVKQLDNEKNQQDILDFKEQFNAYGVMNYEQMLKEMVKAKGDIQRLEKKLEGFDDTTRMVHGSIKQGIMKVTTTDTGTTIRMATPKEMKILREKGILKKPQTAKTNRSKK